MFKLKHAKSLECNKFAEGTRHNYNSTIHLKQHYSGKIISLNYNSFDYGPFLNELRSLLKNLRRATCAARSGGKFLCGGLSAHSASDRAPSS